MSEYTDLLIRALLRERIDVTDLRGQLPAGSGHWRERNPEALSGVVVHHAAGVVDGVDGVIAVARYHVAAPPAGRGWPGIGYFASVARNGVVHIHRDLEVWGAHADYDARPGSENETLIGLLVMGNFRGPHNDTPAKTQQEPTWQQVWAVLAFYRACLSIWPEWDRLPDRGLLGHFELGKPACPGATLEAIIRAAREAA